MNCITCDKCGKKFDYVLVGNVYPGGKDKEYVDCPHCGHTYRTIMTSQNVAITKLDDNGKPID